MAHSSPEGIELSKGSQLVSLDLSINQEKVLVIKQQERSYGKGDMFDFSQWISHNDWVYLPSKDYWVNEEQEELEQKLSSEQILELFEQSKKK